MKTAKFPLIVLAALAVLLAGCTTNGTVPSPSPPTSVSPSATPDVLAGVGFGDVLTQEQADSVEARQDGSHAYRLADGTYVLTSYKAPLSDTVKADVAANIDASKSVNTNGITIGIEKGVSDMETATGRKLIAIVPVSAMCNPSDSTPRPAWTTVTAREYLPCVYEKATAVATATAFIAKQTTPGQWDLVISG